MALQSLILPIISLFRSAGISQAANALRGLTGQFGSLSGQIGAAAASFSAFQALSGSRQFTIDAINATAKFERNLLGLNQVFEELQPRLVSFTREVESYGLSQTQAAQASVFLGSVLKQYGFTTDETAFQTERLVKLSQDLATTYGYDVSEALLAVTALFRGEYDPIEKFGVAMKQNEVNARLAAQGLNDLEGEALANAQAIARLEMLFERAGDSIGAFERASNTLYGSQQKLNAVLGNLQLAAGAPLQEPLANINNIFSEILQNAGPGLTQIFEALAQSVDTFAPLIKELGTFLFGLLQPLQQVINILNGLLAPVINLVVVPAFQVLNGVLNVFNALLDSVGAQLRLFELNFKRVAALVGNTDFAKTLEPLINLDVEAQPAILALNFLTKEFELAGDAARAAAGDFDAFESSDRQLSAGYRRRAADARASKNDFEKLDAALRGAASGARDAEGKLDGLAGVFQKIDNAADQSKAKQAMEDLGLSAAFIEEVLTRPNWEEIFGRISRLARLTAIDIRKVMSVTAAAGIMNEIDKIKKELDNLFKSSTTKETVKNNVDDFFTVLKDEVAKQRAAIQLEAMGASEGLIEAILGAEGWMKIWIQIKQGNVVLEELQKQFNKTAAGARELAEAAKAAKDPVKEFLDALGEDVQKNLARAELKLKGASEGLIDSILGSEAWSELVKRINSGTIALRDLQEQFNKTADGARELEAAAEKIRQAQQEFNETIRAIDKELKEQLAKIAQRAEEVKTSFTELLTSFDVLPTIAREIGQFEQAVVNQLDSIEGALKDAFDNKDILESAFRELQNYARRELSVLADIGRQRDDLVKRYDLAKGLIDNYRKALTASLSLTQLFGRLKDETETRTVTSVSKGMVTLGRSLRSFEVQISKSYEEPIRSIQDKSKALIESFRDMAVKARDFASNLRKLRQMELDPRLFAQLVEAGVEAGGATAQALVESGSGTINELNDLYREIDDVGASLGEEVAVSLYGSGVDLVDGLLAGIRSKQLELENQARAMAIAFNNAFNSSITVAVTERAKIASQEATASAVAEVVKATEEFIEKHGYAPEVTPGISEVLGNAIEETIKTLTTGLKTVTNELENVSDGLETVTTTVTDPLADAVQTTIQVNQAALAQIQGLIAGANRYIGNVKDAALLAGGIVKRGIYQGLEADILAGRAIDLSGIRSGMSSADLAAAAIAAGGTTVNNSYNIQVTANTRTDGSKAGEAVVEALRDFSIRNGAFDVQVAV